MHCSRTLLTSAGIALMIATAGSVGITGAYAQTRDPAIQRNIDQQDPNLSRLNDPANDRDPANARNLDQQDPNNSRLNDQANPRNAGDKADKANKPDTK